MIAPTEAAEAAAISDAPGLCCEPFETGVSLSASRPRRAARESSESASSLEAADVRPAVEEEPHRPAALAAARAESA